jgi:hypothetical protein
LRHLDLDDLHLRPIRRAQIIQPLRREGIEQIHPVHALGGTADGITQLNGLPRPLEGNKKIGQQPYLRRDALA